MVNQNPITLLTPVREDCFEKLNEILERFKVGLNAGLNERFNQLGTLHYARWFVLREDSFRDKTAFPVPVRLVFSSNFDGSEEEHVTGLITVFPEYFDQLYECCVDYPEHAARNAESRKNYLMRWKVITTAFYVGAPGRSLKQIKQEDQLKEYIWNIINENKPDGKPAVEIQKFIQQKVDANPDFEWSKKRADVPALNWPGIIIMFLILSIMLPVLIIWLL